MQPRRIAEVNRELKARGRAERLRRVNYKGTCYYIFAGGDADRWYTQSVMVNSAELLSLKEWMNEFDSMRKAGEKYL